MPFGLGAARKSGSAESWAIAQGRAAADRQPIGDLHGDGRRQFKGFEVGVEGAQTQAERRLRRKDRVGRIVAVVGAEAGDGEDAEAVGEHRILGLEDEGHGGDGENAVVAAIGAVERASGEAWAEGIGAVAGAESGLRIGCLDVEIDGGAGQAADGGGVPVQGTGSVDRSGGGSAAHRAVDRRRPR